MFHFVCPSSSRNARKLLLAVLLQHDNRRERLPHNSHLSASEEIRIEQIAAVYRSLFVQVRELVCNGHSVQLGDLGVLRFAIHAKISADLEGGGGAAVTQKRIRFDASKIMRQKLQTVSFVV